MIEMFKEWIYSVLCLGILVSILELVMPSNNIKKYVYILMGIITIITIVSPVVNLINNPEILQSTSDVLDKLENVPNSEHDIIANTFKDSLKKSIIDRLLKEGILINEIDIKVSTKYDVEKMEVDIKEGSRNKVVECINIEFEIPKEKLYIKGGN